MNPSSLKLDLASAHCISLELAFALELPDGVRQELQAVGSRESEEDDRIFFHQDYRYDAQKLHSWAEVRFADEGPSDIIIEYLGESELEDQTELHQTDFTLSHLFSALESVDDPIEAFFTLRFDLGTGTGSRFLRLLPYNAGINGGLSVEYRGAHVQIRTPEDEVFDVWYDLRPDDVLEATLRFSLNQTPTAELPKRGLEYGEKALARVLGP
ncbi:MAG: hypothetical protein V3V35_02265 [Dehalococcoidia bacterium]